MADRIEDVEIKVAYLEKQVEDLDEVVRELYGKLEALGREVTELRATSKAQGGVLSSPNLEDERPPHYHETLE